MAERRMIIYRGAEMIETWPHQITAAQAITAWEIAGSFYERIRCGNERDDWGAKKYPCGDCGVIRGELHVPGCDIEQCARCGGQSIGCGCGSDDST